MLDGLDDEHYLVPGDLFARVVMVWEWQIAFE